MSEHLKIQRVSRDIVENQLLISLEDKSKVALLLTIDDLNIIIGAFRGNSGRTQKEMEMLEDILTLRKEAFNVSPNL